MQNRLTVPEQIIVAYLQYNEGQEDQCLSFVKWLELHFPNWGTDNLDPISYSRCIRFTYRLLEICLRILASLRTMQLIDDTEPNEEDKHKWFPVQSIAAVEKSFLDIKHKRPWGASTQ